MWWTHQPAHTAIGLPKDEEQRGVTIMTMAFCTSQCAMAVAWHGFVWRLEVNQLVWGNMWVVDERSTKDRGLCDELVFGLTARMCVLSVLCERGGCRNACIVWRNVPE